MDKDNQAQLEQLRPAGVKTPIQLFLDDREVPDPYYGGDDGFAVMMDLIESGVRKLMER
jgi:protein-tyrosine phosphatase